MTDKQNSIVSVETPSRSMKKLLDAAVEIQGEPDAAEMAFMARAGVGAKQWPIDADHKAGLGV